MKHFILFYFILFFIILASALISTGLVYAVGFSPSSLVFELEQNETGCQMITLDSNSNTIIVSDKWANSSGVEWRVSLFDETADYHNLTITYDNELLKDEREVNVCLFGEVIGEYKGVMLLKEEQEGNSVIQMGVWLKAVISEPILEPIPEQPAPATSEGGGGSSSGSSSGGGGGSIKTQTMTNQVNETLNLTQLSTEQEEVTEELDIQEEEIQEEAQEEQGSQAGITGAVIGGLGDINVIGIFFAVIIIAGIIIYQKRSKQYE